MSEVQQTIKTFIVDEIMHGTNAENLQSDTALLDEGILDSLGLQLLITFLEGKYDIMVDDDFLMPEYFESIETITKLIEELKNN